MTCRQAVEKTSKAILAFLVFFDHESITGKGDKRNKKDAHVGVFIIQRLLLRLFLYGLHVGGVASPLSACRV